jgi:hypothetical protein
VRRDGAAQARSTRGYGAGDASMGPPLYILRVGWNAPVLSIVVWRPRLVALKIPSRPAEGR